MIEVPADILERASCGDEAAFYAFYKASSGYVYNVAYRFTGSRPDAEEITQDVFLKASRALRGFKGNAALSTWLYRVTANAAMDHRKKIFSHEKKIRNLERTALEAPAGPGPDESMECAERESWVRGLLQKLPPERRICLILREIEGLDYQEISKILGIPLNTVRTRIKRAREALMGLARKEVASHAL